jgi:predicted TIM-barrel fold metal-dependent hydrolase
MPHPSTFTASIPRFAVPDGACDCHIHVFGPAERYPLRRDRVYTPADALPADSEAMLSALGLERVVLVQASVYGTDNQCMLDGLRVLGQRARGVAVIAPDIAEDELKALHAAGVRGVRLNIASGHDRSVAKISAEMRKLADRISPLGWHLQLFVRPHLLPDLQPIVGELDIDVVIDHMGLVPAEDCQENPGFSALLSMLDNGRIWVKASGAYRVGSESGPWDNVAPMARALIESRPDRIVWGSDWPHPPLHGRDAVDHETVMPFRPLDTGHLFDLLADWSPDPEIRRLILVSNPTRLYDFETVV